MNEATNHDLTVVLQRFDEAWVRGPTPDLDDFLAQCAKARPQELLIELVEIDLERRWSAAAQEYAALALDAPTTAVHAGALPEFPLLEDYARRYPLLGTCESWPLKLIAEEYRVRCRWGDRPSHDEYRRKFSSRDAADLERWLANIDQQLSAEAAGRKSASRHLPHLGNDPLLAGASRDAGPRELDPLDTLPVLTLADSNYSYRFRVLRPHAEGGLGRVFVAYDKELNREVALKELRPEFAADLERRLRFALEAEITGGLDHPGIVPVYSLGKHADGSPFYAMRFVRGDSLMEAIEQFHTADRLGRLHLGERSLELRKLLGRFIDVCQAIDYAHSRGVLHRDLKPGNIMLGKYGETLVVDWGLAKAQGRGDLAPLASEAALEPVAGSAITPTQMGSTLGTLAYMSPEQAEGRHDLLGTSTDVFSLGATLYHLLTGRPPYAGRDRKELLRRARSAEYPWPRTIEPRMPRALEAVCLRAMAKEPGNRYGTPRDLLSDVESWLADEPVAALPETRLDRALRWLRRHQAWTLSAVVALSVLVVAATATAWMVNQARRETAHERDRNRLLAERNERLAQQERAARELAESRRQLAVEHYRDARRAVDVWLTGMSDLLRYYPGVQQARHSLLELAAEDLEKLAQHQSDDPDLELERGRAWMRLGEVRSLRGELDHAAQAYAQAERILVAVGGTKSLAAGVGRVEVERVHLKSALLSQVRGEVTSAERLLAQAGDALEALGGQSNRDEQARALLAAVYLHRGSLLIDLQRTDEALSFVGQAQTLLGKLLEIEPANPSYQRNFAAAAAIYARAALERGAFTEAATRAQQARQQLSRLVFAHPDHPEYLSSRAAAGVDLAAALHSLARYDEEQRALAASLADYLALERAVPDQLEFLEARALTQVNLAQAQQYVGRCPDTRTTVEPVVTELEKLAGLYPKEPRFQEALATATAILGQALSELGERSAAREALVKASTLLRQLRAEFPDIPIYRERAAAIDSQLGQLLAKEGDQAQGLDSLNRARDAFEQLAAQFPSTPRYRTGRALVLEALGDLHWEQEPEQAIVKYQEAARLWEAVAAPQDAVDCQRQSAWFFATCRGPQMRNARALALAELAARAAPTEALVQTTHALALVRAERWTEARSALKLAESLSTHPCVWNNLVQAMVRHHEGDEDGAKQLLKSSDALARETRPDFPPLARLQDEIRALVGELPANPPSDNQ